MPLTCLSNPGNQTDLKPKTGLFSIDNSFLKTRHRYILAWKATHQDIHVRQIVTTNRANIIKDLRFWPMFLEYFLTEFVLLDLEQNFVRYTGGLERPLCAKLEAADTSK